MPAPFLPCGREACDRPEFETCDQCPHYPEDATTDTPYEHWPADTPQKVS